MKALIVLIEDDATELDMENLVDLIEGLDEPEGEKIIQCEHFTRTRALDLLNQEEN